jgi:hypothetical protein
LADQPPQPRQPLPAAEAIISLSQALLAPLDAIFKAQLHAARSFLNLLLQLGYPHHPVDETGQTTGPAPGTAAAKQDGLPYTLDFDYEIDVDGQTKKQRVSVPALALVPVAPLAVDSAEFRFDMAVREIGPHEQIQASEGKAVQPEGDSGFDRFKRPWFLVDDPVSIRGTIVQPPTAPTQSSQEASIHIEVKVTSIKIPSGLDKLLTSLTQSTRVIDKK